MVRFIGCVAATLLVAVIGCSSADHYRVHKDGKSLYAVLHETVRAGDSVEKVQGLLGTGQSDQDNKALEGAKKLAAKNHDGWPEGVSDGDTMIGYAFDGGATLWLQFRNARLINYNAADFARYEPMVSVVGSSPSS